jgi:competence protein CoiA
VQAQNKAGVVIDPLQVPAPIWEALKASWALGDYTWTCCGGAAVLKSSQYGHRFFAHYRNECTTAPETIWHQEGKAIVLATLQDLGVAARSEVPGTSGKDSWTADTWFQHEGRTIVIELQRSYQHLRDYQRRQGRYVAAGIECFWLTRNATFMTFIKSSAQHRIRVEFGGRLPERGLFPLLPGLPVSELLIAEETQRAGSKAGLDHRAMAPRDLR